MKSILFGMMTMAQGVNVPLPVVAVTEPIGDDATCLIEANDVVDVAPGTSGIISSLLVSRGDTVTEGQTVASLRADIERASLKLAEARAANAAGIKAAEARVGFESRRRERAKVLSSRDVLTQTALDEAETDYQTASMNLSEARKIREIARLEVDRQKAIIAEKTIISPVNGVVVDVSASEGEFGKEGEILMVLAEIDPLRVQAFLPIRHYGLIKVGDTALITPDGLMTQNVTATVTAVDQVLDAASGTFGAVLELPNPERKIPAGLKCQISFVIQ